MVGLPRRNLRARITTTITGSDSAGLGGLRGLRLRSCALSNEDAVTRLIGALLLEQNGKWAVQRARCMTLETIARSAMISPSICHPWQPDRAANAARHCPCHAMAWDMVSGLRLQGNRLKGSGIPARAEV
jgi:hypothetical protein